MTPCSVSGDPTGHDVARTQACSVRCVQQLYSTSNSDTQWIVSVTHWGRGGKRCLLLQHLLITRRSWFRLSAITYFNGTVSTFSGWFLQSGIRPFGWLCGLSPVFAQITVSSVKSCFHQMRLPYGLTALQPFNVFCTSKAVCTLFTELIKLLYNFIPRIRQAAGKNKCFKLKMDSAVRDRLIAYRQSRISKL